MLSKDSAPDRAARNPDWAIYLIPIVVCLAVHWSALRTWFFADDFAWLWMTPKTHHFHDVVENLFYPMAEGTVRILSERLFFIVYEALFGLNATPYHITVMVTQLANVALLAWIAHRLTGSRLAAVLAPVFWCANPGITKSLAWLSAFNEVLCSFFLLAAFACLLRYVDTKSDVWWKRQWIAFLLGFGALELIVVYPAIAALYAWLFARRHFRRTLWLFIPSGVFGVIHWMLAARTHVALYTFHLDRDLPKTLWTYFALAAGALRPDRVSWLPDRWRVLIAIVLAAALLLFTAWKARRGEWLTVFCVAWFLLLLGPMLPLKNHFSDYYLTVPAIGLALLGATGMAAAFRSGVLFSAGTVLLAAAYLVVGVSDAWSTHDFYRNMSLSIKRIVLGVEAGWRLAPRPVVFLAGVSDLAFWAGFPHKPLEHLIGIPAVYLTLEASQTIYTRPEWGGAKLDIANEETIFESLHAGQALVFDVTNGFAVNVTACYQEISRAGYLAHHRRIVEAGDPLYSSRMRQGWHPPERGYRWMGKTATVEMGGPDHAGESLEIAGYFPALQAKDGPVKLTVSVDGAALGALTAREADKPFTASFALPAHLTGKYAIEIGLESSRASHFGTDPRELGLALTKFEIR